MGKGLSSALEEITAGLDAEDGWPLTPAQVGPFPSGTVGSRLRWRVRIGDVLGQGVDEQAPHVDWSSQPQLFGKRRQ